MKAIAVLLVISAVASGIEWTDFRTKWITPSKDPNRLNSFLQLPRTSNDAISEGWVRQTGLNSLDLTTYCYPDDGQTCLLYDSFGYIAGFMVNILKADMDPVKDVYKPENFDIYSTKMIYGNSYVTTTVYFQNPSDLPTGRSSSWDGMNGVEGVWIEKINGECLVIPRFAKNLASYWTKQACIPAMGTHYYYAMNTTTECKDFYPFNCIYVDGELNAMALQGYGTCTVYSRDWCEPLKIPMINVAIPTRPDCLVEWAAKYGAISRHFYFASNPWNNTCS